MRAFWLLVLPLLAFAGYLAVRVTREGETLRHHELQALLDGRLSDVRTRASHAMDAIERQLGAELAPAPTEPEELRALARKLPLANAIFRLDREGRMLFPHGNELSAAEREFLIRTRTIWTQRAILDGAASEARPEISASAKRERTLGGPNPSTGETAHARTAKGTGDSLVDLAGESDHGWLSWYWAEGLHLLYWQRAADGGVIGVELERVGVLARIVGALPTKSADDGRMELADSRGQTVHQWGVLDGGTSPDATLALAQPLESWHLRYFLAPAQKAALVGGTETGTLLGLGAAGLAALALAFYVYREYTRKLRDAARRVGFVTRVSHELRTPLANIRMYAELLEGAADEDPEQERRARVIVSESERLGRLIDNVLAFGRKHKAQKPVAIDVNTAVRDTVAKFEPALAQKQIDLHVELTEAPATARAGAGAVEQIVTNLMSNVEKYATGTAVTVTTRAEAGHVVVDVADRGPGVPAHERGKIFEPFHRASDALTDRTNGTGIGLAIARELARAAGGDLVLADADRGACFQLTLPAEEP